MWHEFYVTIEGTKQGKFKGESVREAHEETIGASCFGYQVQSPRDVATGAATGKRVHQPVTFVKEWGPASPQLFQALTTNEVLKSALFEFVHTTADGTEEVYHTVKLTNATVVSIRQYTSGGQGSGLPAHGLEEVALAFQAIEIESKTGKTMAADNWTQ